MLEGQWESKKACRESFVALVDKLGKYQGEKPYVPYFWEHIPEDKIEWDTHCYRVTQADREIFPELASVEWVYLKKGFGDFSADYSVKEVDDPADY